jgi:formylglycine-generating enzyme required for sulfatase activity
MRLRLFAITFLALAAVPGGSLGRASAAGFPDREFTECRQCPAMVAIPAGRFVMGSPSGEPGRFDTEGPQHVVSVSAFALAKYDVTSAAFLSFLKDTGYQPKPCDPRLGMGWHSPGNGLAYPPSISEPPHWPAACLDWRDAEAYVAWLNKKVRIAHPDITYGAGPYRLPSEAEWEYAARAGSETARPWGGAIGAGHANCNGCGSPWDYKLLSDVDSFPPNAFGLYGMLGNVWQWTADCWHESYVGAPADGSAWTEPDCTRHVLRGGSWDNTPIFIRSAARTAGEPDGTEYDYSSLAGFRVARTLP